MRARARPDDRVFAPDRFSDWMLFKIPELRGRIAYDVRFELYDARVLRRPPGLRLRGRPDWKSFADGYRIVIVDETPQSHTADFLDEPGARVDLPRRRDHDRRAPRAVAPLTCGTRARRPRSNTSSSPHRPDSQPSASSVGRRVLRTPREDGDRRDSQRSAESTTTHCRLARRRDRVRRGVAAERCAPTPCSTALTGAPSGTSATARSSAADVVAGTSSPVTRAASPDRPRPRPEDERDRDAQSEDDRRPRAGPRASALEPRVTPKTVAAIEERDDRGDAVIAADRSSTEVRRARSRGAAADATAASPGESRNRKSERQLRADGDRRCRGPRRARRARAPGSVNSVSRRPLVASRRPRRRSRSTRCRRREKARTTT